MITQSLDKDWKALVRYLGGGSYADGCDLVTEWCKEHGYTETYTEGILYHNYTSAKDAARMMEDIFNGRFAHSKDMMYWLTSQERVNKIPAGVPNGVVVGNKTGELNDSVSHTENDIAIVYSPYGTYILGVYSTKITNATAISIIKGISTIVYNFFN